ncbi:MAG: acetyl-CoA decarbonylase/synthase complex subunit gamma [Planctomycetota bacterium]
MALTGLAIFKLLPKTNCKDCGKPTCLAFAMSLAAKKAELKECPHVSEEAKTALEGAAAPPIKLVKIGAGDGAFQTGEETVLFRHDEKFYNPTGLAIRLTDSMDDGAFKEKLDKINALRFERVGQKIAVNLVALEDKSGSAETFAAAAKKLADGTDFHIILMSSNPGNMKAAVAQVKDRRPLLYGANTDNVDAMTGIAKEAGCPIGVKADTLETLAELTQKIKAGGVEEIVIDPMPGNFHEAIKSFTTIRRLALKKTFRPLGFPIIAFASNKDPHQETMDAGAFICKYAGIVVMNGTEPWQILPLLTLRMNIFTDPQKPIQVEPKIYKVGDANENSPLMCTTNFSLTYFTVEGEVESSRVPSYILSVDTEGTSVLTAYSADKFNEKTIHQAMEKADAEHVVKHKKLIIPGFVAVLSGKLEEETGWEIMVGPKEASFIPKYLKEIWK